MNIQYYTEIIDRIIAGNLNKDQINRIKIKLCSKYKVNKIPTDIEILLNASPDVIPKLNILQTKPTRSLSGVAVVAVMTRPRKCPHGRCIMCPGGPNSDFGDVPQSYTGKEPATRRAMRNRFNPYLQVFNRLEQYIVTGHVPDKIELIIMGGTFPASPKRYQNRFVTDCFRAFNDFSRMFFRNGKVNIIKFRKFFELPGDIYDEKRNSRVRKKIIKLNSSKSDLISEQKKNEKSVVKCIGMTIETRPDYASKIHAEQMLKLGCTRVELGVQTIYDDILKNIKRGHTVRDSIDSTKTLKDLGFKINYHMMPGLPGMNLKKDLESLKKIFKDSSFRPDMLKIYPCMVLKGTEIFKIWKSKKFNPISTKQAAELIAEFKQHVPEYVRIMRVQRDIPTFMTEAGVDKTNLRQYIHNIMKKRKIECRCIRCREAGRNELVWKKYKIKIIEYEASKGKEFFIVAESEDKVLGFLRLRIPSSSLLKEITNKSSIVRELHVFGEAIALGQKGDIQHRGIGKTLLKKAEKLTKKERLDKIVVISGVGARNYYRKNGYRKEGPYMSKKI